MNAFIEFINKNRDILNWMALEKVAGIPARTMYKHFSGAQNLPEKHIPEIIRVLCEHFGAIEIGGTTFRFESGTFFWERHIPDQDVEIKEVDGHFEYLAPQYRGVEDNFDMTQFFKNTENKE